MTLKPACKNVGIIALFVLAGVLVGLVAGQLIHHFFLPPWHSTQVDTDDLKITEIISITYTFAEEEHLHDRLFVKTENGDLYTRVKGLWQPLPALAEGYTPLIFASVKTANDSNDLVLLTGQGQNFQLIAGQWQPVAAVEYAYGWYDSDDCAKAWQPRPPLGANVLDSAGKQHHHALSVFKKCYVLRQNGSIQVWTRWQDVFSMMGISVTAIIGGGVLGGLIGFFRDDIFKPKPAKQQGKPASTPTS